MRLGEVILKCEPFAHVVDEDRKKSVCDFCLKTSNNDLPNCGRCGHAFYCGKACQTAAWKEFHREECKFFKEGGRFRSPTARLIARIVVKLRAGKGDEPVTLPNGSRRSFNDLMSHVKEIAKDRKLSGLLMSLHDDLKNFFKENAPPMEEVRELYGRIQINSFGIRDERQKNIGTGLYLEASVFDHACSPNAVYSTRGKTLSVRSIVDDPNLSFEDVRITYTDPFCNTATRRASLRERYYFECKCVACESDPGGLDLLKQSSMRCRRCKSAVHVEDDDAGLKCPKCSVWLDARAFGFLKGKVAADLMYNMNFRSMWELDEMAVRYAEDMFKANFHPYDEVYLRVLTTANRVLLSKEEFRGVLENFSELIVAYKGLFPKYWEETAQMLRRAGEQAMKMKQFAKAETFLLEARDILAVTHGEDHPAFLNLLETLSSVSLGKHVNVKAKK